MTAGASVPVNVPPVPDAGGVAASINVCLPGVGAEKGPDAGVEQRRIRETIELLAPAVDVRRL